MIVLLDVSAQKGKRYLGSICIPLPWNRWMKMLLRRWYRDHLGLAVGVLVTA